MKRTSVTAPVDAHCDVCGEDISGSCLSYINGRGPLCPECAASVREPKQKGEPMNPISTAAMWTPRPACPDCGLVVGMVERPHDCRVPKLVAAIGVPLDERERNFLRWLAKYHDASEVLVGILEKVKQ